MNKPTALICFIFLLSIFSCAKMNDVGKMETQSTFATSQTSPVEETVERASSSYVGCRNTLARNNYNAIKQANNVPFNGISGSFLVAAINSNFVTYTNCTDNVGNGGEEGEEPEEHPEPPDNWPVHDMDVAAALNCLSGSYVDIYSNSNKTILSALLDALDYINPLYVTDPSERMIAISKAVYELGYGNIFVDEFYHGDTDPKVIAVYIIIELFSGKSSLTDSLYNQYIAASPNDYITFPATRSFQQVVITPSGNLISTLPTVSLQYDSHMEYETDLDILLTPGINEVSYSTAFFYNSADSKLYTSSSYVTYIPNGYYYLPYNHPNTFEKNNYIIELYNGAIINQFSRP